MDLLIDCPHCEKPIKLPSDPSRLVGTSQECPHCSERGLFQLDADGNLNLWGAKKVEPALASRFTDQNEEGKRWMDAERKRLKGK